MLSHHNMQKKTTPWKGFTSICSHHKRRGRRRGGDCIDISNVEVTIVRRLTSSGRATRKRQKGSWKGVLTARYTSPLRKTFGQFSRVLSLMNCMYTDVFYFIEYKEIFQSLVRFTSLDWRFFNWHLSFGGHFVIWTLSCSNRTPYCDHLTPKSPGHFSSKNSPKLPLSKSGKKILFLRLILDV